MKAAMAAGRSLDQIKASVTMAEYQSWGAYEQFRPRNVAGMYRRLRSRR